jgi:hypothetical protein
MAGRCRSPSKASPGAGSGFSETCRLFVTRIPFWSPVPARETYRRVGVSAFAKHHQLRRDLLIIIAMSKSSLTSPDADTPIRRPADTLPQYRSHIMVTSLHQNGPSARSARGPFRRVFATCGTVGTRSRASRGSTSDNRVGCSASDGRCAPARPALNVSTPLLPFLPCALAGADCIRPFS